MEERQGEDTVLRGPRIDTSGYTNKALWPFLRNKMLSHGNAIAMVSYLKYLWKKDIEN